MAVDIEAYMQTLPIKKRKNIEQRAQELIEEEKKLKEFCKVALYPRI